MRWRAGGARVERRGRERMFLRDGRRPAGERGLARDKPDTKMAGAVRGSAAR